MRVPPSWANSATTPASRRLTSSIKAGGNDHSRPTSKPTFCVMARLPLLHSSCSLIVTVDVEGHHLLPIGPVVRPAIPDAQRVPDIFAPENAGEILIVGARRIVAADRQGDVDASQRIQPLLVMLVG